MMRCKNKSLLHKPHGKNRYCGPSVISAITGMSTDDAAYQARNISGRKYIKSMSQSLLRRTLNVSGCEVGRVLVAADYRDRPHSGAYLNFADWADMRTDEEFNSIMVVGVTGHWVVIYKNMAVDNRHKDWEFYREAHFARWRFTEAFVVKVVKPVKVQKIARPKRDNWKRKCEKAAAALHLHVYRESKDWYYVGNDSDDHDYLEHLAEGHRLSGYSWEDLWWAIREMEDDAKDYIAKHGLTARA